MAYRPYDGQGRYSMDKDDGVRSVQGLFALAARFGAKPYKGLSDRDGIWQTERVIFKDVDTGTTVIRYTNDPWSDQLSYFQGNWSADGKYIVFRRRPGMWESSTPTHGPMAMNADGTDLRNVFRQYPMVGNEVCSPTEPNVCYAVADDTKVIAFDIATGAQTRLVREVPRGWRMKISPDGKYLMNRAETSKGKGIWIASVDGQEFYEIALPEAIHDSYCFHPSQNKVLFWYEGKFHDEGFVQCEFDGSHITKVHVKYDWNHGDFGIDRGVHEGGFITRATQDNWLAREDLFQKTGVEYYDEPLHSNGYVSWRPKDRLWSYNTRIVDQPHVSEIQAMSTEPASDFVVNRYRVSYTALQRGKSLDNPNASPDGTKVLFNSNFLGSNNIFGVVARLPERPTDLKAEETSDGFRLSWQPAAHHVETAGYHLYRSRTSGIGYVPLTAKPVKQTSVISKTVEAGEGYFYAITAVEHSGLESGLSAEVQLHPRPEGPRHIFIEVSQARLSPEMWVAFHGSACDLHYIWMRKNDGKGTAMVRLEGDCQSKISSATLWARVRGEKGVEFAISAGQSEVAIKTQPLPDWTWVKADKKLNLSGVKELALSSTRYGSAIDCLWLTDDEDFHPDKTPRIVAPPAAPPEGFQSRVLSPYAARLAWHPAKLATLHHYNVYCGDAADFTPDQTTLVASPDRPTIVDWPLKPGSRYYYRLTSVDRFGNESPASPAKQVETPAIQSTFVDKDPAQDILFDVPAKDTYVVWLLLKKDGDDRGYIDVKCYRRIPPARGAEVTPSAGSSGSGLVLIAGGSWVGDTDGLSDSTWLSYEQWGRFVLDRGSYVLQVTNKTGSKLEKVHITNDLSYKPPGHVNILSGW